MADPVPDEKSEWWKEIDALKAQLAAVAATGRTPLYDTRTGIVYWMMLSSFIIIVLLWWKTPTGDNTLLNTLLGMYIGTGLIGAIQWWMGSSKGSDDKTAVIAAQQVTAEGKK